MHINDALLFILHKVFLRQSIFGTPISAVRLSKSIKVWILKNAVDSHIKNSSCFNVDLDVLLPTSRHLIIGTGWHILTLSSLSHLPQRVWQQVQLGCGVDLHVLCCIMWYTNMYSLKTRLSAALPTLSSAVTTNLRYFQTMWCRGLFNKYCLQHDVSYSIP